MSEIKFGPRDEPLSTQQIVEGANRIAALVDERKQQMSVRAKFECVQVITESEGEVATVELLAVTSGSPENDRFFKYTPGDSIVLTCVDTRVAQFKAGENYYVDFTSVVGD